MRDYLAGFLLFLAFSAMRQPQRDFMERAMKAEMARLDAPDNG